MEPRRKRAQSLFSPIDDDEVNFMQLHRVHSDGDVNTADRSQPLGETEQPLQLLERVLAALGNIKAADDAQSMAAMSGGVNGFSDSQILSGEKGDDSRWSVSYSDTSFSLPPPKARGRAASDFRAPVPNDLEYGGGHDWTWSGNNQQIEEFMRMRRLNKRKEPDLYRAALTLPSKSNEVTVNIEESPSLPSIAPPRDRSPSIFERLNPFRRREGSRKASLAPEVKNYLEATANGRESRLSAAPYQDTLSPPMKRRVSGLSALSATDENSANILENTTIADLIRALEVMHTQAVTGENSLETFLSGRRRPHSMSESQAPNSPTNVLQQPLPLINIHPTSPTKLRDRRGSMRPFSSANTPLFQRANRRVSVNADLVGRRSSMLVPPSFGPPPYSENTPRTTHRRFSVRPTLLSIPPGQSPMPSIQAVGAVQKRLSMRPNPLATDYGSINNISRPHRTARSISIGSNSDSPLDASPLPNRQSHFLSVNETHFANPQNRRLSRQLFSPKTKPDHKRCDSK